MSWVFPYSKHDKTRVKGEGKGQPITCHEDREREYSYRSTLSLTSALDGVDGQRHDSAALPPGMNHNTLCIGCWLGPRAGLDGYKKSRPPPGLDPQTAQSD